MGNVYPLFFYKLYFFVRTINTVGHNGRAVFSAKKIKPAVSVPVKSAFGAKLLYPGNLAGIFGKMRLYRQFITFPDFSQLFHQFI